MLTMLSFGGSQLNILLVACCILLCWVLTTTGELVLRGARITNVSARLPAAFVVGFAAVSLIMVFLNFVITLRALSAFWISCLMVVILALLNRNKFIESHSDQWTDVFIAAMLTVAIGLLTIIPVSGPETMLTTGVLPIWSDYFLHGVTIASLGSIFASGVDMELAGVSISFYHYAPFIIPAAFQAVSGMSGLALSTSFLLPMGLLIAAFGSYVFAVMLGGRLLGLLALTVIVCLPAFSVLIQSGWFDFYWLLFATPGTGYALGVSAIVCTLTVSYLKQKNGNILLLALVLLASVILIRVHIFMLLAPAIVSMLLLNRWWGKRLLILGLTILVVFVGLIILMSSTRIHTFWLEHAHPYDYLNIALQWSLFHGQKINLLDYPLVTSAIKLTLILMAVLGVYLIGFPIALWLSIRRFGFQAKDMLPLLLVASFIGLMLFAPTAANGDFTEYKHRHFTLLYVIVAIYTITYMTSLAPSSIDVESSKAKNLVHGLVMIIFTATIILNWNNNPSRPNVEAMPWASKLDNQSVIPGLLQASQYIVKNARRGDVFATNISSSSTSEVNNLNIQAISLTGIPAFLSRPELRVGRSECVREIVTMRLAVLRELSSMRTWPDAKTLLQQNGVRWFLLTAAEKPQWDPELRVSVFTFDGLSVYDSGEIANKQPIKAKC
ncbi:MAG: hypothetical protein H7240_00895 [Glaciimonas sp.]|nr:hypothetical protein [Glaciimonas sp.]